MRKYLIILATFICGFVPLISHGASYTYGWNFGQNYFYGGTGDSTVTTWYFQCLSPNTPAALSHPAAMANIGNPNSYIAALNNLGSDYYSFTASLPANISIDYYWGTRCSGNSPYTQVIFTDVNPMTPPSPTIAIVTPTNGGVTAGDFPQWYANVTNVTSTNLYNFVVEYGASGGNYTYVDMQNFHGQFLGSPSTLSHSVVLFGYAATTTWDARASLFDLTAGNVLVATSSVVTFSVAPAAGTPGTHATTTVATTSPMGLLMSTNTCSGWTDVACALGNVFANGINFIFGVNQDEINAVSGFNVAVTPPFSFISDIQTTIANANTGSTTLSSSTLAMNLTGTATNVTWFSQTQAERFLGSGFITFIRSLAYAALLLLAIFGFYLEIRKIFVKPHQN